MRIAFVNMGAWRSNTGKKVFCDPVHLVPMHNLATKAGHQSLVLTDHLPDDARFQQTLVEFKPQVLAFSFVSYDPQEVSSALQIVASLSKYSPLILAGGSDLEENPNDYLKAFGGFVSEFVPVVGPGEIFMQRLAGADFKVRSAFPDYQLGTLYSSIERLPLNEQDFNRPYNDFNVYDRTAMVKWATGCASSCGFCGNRPGNVNYRDPLSISLEIIQLKKLGVNEFCLTTPNFLADPTLATAILPAMTLRNDRVAFSARVDGLYTAIKSAPEVWREFAQRRNVIELGVESFLSQRLGPERLKKYRSIEQAVQHVPKLQFILDFFADGQTIVEFDLMLFDYLMNLAELKEEFKVLTGLLDQYGPGIQIVSSLDNYLHYSKNSVFSQDMESADFLKFYRDPRVLFVNLLLKRLYREMVKTVENIDLTFSDEQQLINRLLVGLMGSLLPIVQNIDLQTLRPCVDKIVKIRQISQEKKESYFDIFWRKIPAREKLAIQMLIDGELIVYGPILLSSQVAIDKLYKKLFEV